MFEVVNFFGKYENISMKLGPGLSSYSGDLENVPFRYTLLKICLPVQRRQVLFGGLF